VNNVQDVTQKNLPARGREAAFFGDVVLERCHINERNDLISDLSSRTREEILTQLNRQRCFQDIKYF
jgi:hypothetical protein